METVICAKQENQFWQPGHVLSRLANLNPDPDMRGGLGEGDS